MTRRYSHINVLGPPSSRMDASVMLQRFVGGGETNSKQVAAHVDALLNQIRARSAELRTEEEETVMTNRSDLRLLEKVCHVGALAWTLAFLPALITSLVFPTRAEGNAAATFETSLADYSVRWFVPVAGMELVAFGLSFLTRQPQTPEQTRKEWRNAALVVGVPIVWVVLLRIVYGLWGLARGVPG